jgi:AcrR family transcriptional regulator
VGLREQQALAARQAITNAAFEVFIDAGYANTTIDDIADRADVARRTIYNHFESKGAILLACLDARIAGRGERSLEDDHARFEATDDPREAIALFGRMTGRVAQRFLPLYRVAVEAAAHDGDVAKRLEAQEEGRYHAQAFALRVLRDKGQLRTDVDFEHLHRGFWLLAGPRPVMDALQAGWTLDEYLDYLTDVLQRFLLPGDRAKASSNGNDRSLPRQP